MVLTPKEERILLKPKVQDTLLDLNRRFYRRRAAEFSRTRQQAWQGWRRLLDRVANGRESLSILDLGCGNGRFAAACARQLIGDWRYVGVDSSRELVSEAGDLLEELEPSDYEVKVGDLLAARARFWSLRGFDLVTLFGVMHHVPGRDNRLELLKRAGQCVAPGGVLAISFWQLEDSERLMQRTVEPEAVGLDARALEPGDHLLRWGDGDAARYCHHSGLEEMAEMVDASGMDAVESYRSDGRGDAMNVYWLLTPAEA